MKKKLCSFADSRLFSSLERVRKQGVEMNFFDEIRILTENDLDSEFKLRWQNLLIPGSRGFGYWIWKPQVLLQELATLNEGDHLYYVDAGCHLNPRGIKRLQEYDQLCEESECGIVATSIAYTEKAYTKADLFGYFGVLDRKDITDSDQVQATIIFIRKCTKSVEFIKQWAATYEYDVHLVDDSPSNIPNDTAFVDHRHDQSIFSVLCKLHNATLISAEEVEPPVGVERSVENWIRLNRQPILAMRDRPLTAKLMRKIWKYKFYASLHLGNFSRKYRQKLDKLYQTTPILMNPPPYLRD